MAHDRVLSSADDLYFYLLINLLSIAKFYMYIQAFKL